MANYYGSLTFGTNLVTPAAQRGGTAPSGGTAIALQTYQENIAGVYAATSKMYSAILERISMAIMNHRSAGSNPSNLAYYFTLTDDGSGVLSGSLQFGGVAPSGGTSLTPGKVGFSPVSGASSAVVNTIQDAMRNLIVCILNDKAAGN